jgi:hypothetical protein
MCEGSDDTVPMPTGKGIGVKDAVRDAVATVGKGRVSGVTGRRCASLLTGFGVICRSGSG